MTVPHYIHYFEPDVKDESGDLDDDETDVFYDVPIYPSNFINVANVVDASYCGNPLTRLKRRKIIDDSVMYKKGKSRVQDYRTIMIEKIPSASSLFDIMPATQGDRIISGQMLQTTKLTGSLTARIIFREQKYALDFINLTRYKPSSLNGLTAAAYLVATPTWPNYPAIDPMGFGRATSRCLIIRNAPLHLTEHAIRFWLENKDCKNLLVPPIIKKSANEIVIWFASETAAARGLSTLSGNYRFENLKIKFRDNEHSTNTSIASDLFGISSVRKRNDRQSSTYDTSEKSKFAEKRTMSEFSCHDVEGSAYVYDAYPRPLSGTKESDAKRILAALSIIEDQCRTAKGMVGIDLHLMTTNELQLRSNATEEGMSLIQIAQEQQRLIACIEQLSSQLERSTLIRKTLDDFHQMLHSLTYILHQYLKPASTQQNYMDVFDRARAFKKVTNDQPCRKSTCAGTVINNLQTTMQKLLSLASSIRNKRPRVTDDGELPNIEEKHKDEMTDSVLKEKTDGVTNMSVTETMEDENPAPASQTNLYDTNTAVSGTPRNWFLDTDRFTAETKLYRYKNKQS